ncbi:MAG: polynucleotide adenylyltransferase PcnB [Treponema sp.]|nr:polynucleotide adenylyltransferase PcnB [Treponema sp.]
MRIRYSTEKDGRPVKKAIVYTQDEHGIDSSKVDTDAVMIVKRLRANGFETYIVGGAVRDLILGQAPKDFDIVSDASPANIRQLFRNARIIGHRFRLVHVALGAKLFEVSTFRSLKDGLTSNTYGTIEEDVQRRDFSMNALFYDPIEQLVVDYVDGMKDIWKKQVRPIIPLSTIFTDDPVRMIRAVKYGATTGFHIPLQVQWKIRRQVSLLSSVSPSRLTEEIFKIIHSPHAAHIVENLNALGIYAYLQPNAAARMQNHEFNAQYLQRLAAEKTNMEQALASLIAAFLENDNSIVWDEAHFKEVCLAARSFILPMNPPRVLLDRAVRLLFKEHDVIVKRAPWFANNSYRRKRSARRDTDA